MKKIPLKGTAFFLIPAIFIASIASGVSAGFTPSPETSAAQGREADLLTIQRALESKVVKARLAQMGFSPEEIKGKLKNLDADSVHQLALKADELKVGGDPLLGIGIGLIAMLVLVLIVAAIAHFKAMDED
ncbi:MAG TPA: PA2779 family protein [Thermodesulfobacteriota bacterium]|nr:PA2779 family protein [Thermodesulfobacteriota bacterium]